MDIKYILGSNPLMPAYQALDWPEAQSCADSWTRFDEGQYQVGHAGKSFAYDNECPQHTQYLHSFEIRENTVSNREYIHFIENGGYSKATFWLSHGWDWLQKQGICAPLYWFKRGNVWYHYTLHGVKKVDPNAPVCHISYFEADALARWLDLRLPTEFELEVSLRSNDNQDTPVQALYHPTRVDAPLQQWCWTSSHYSAYPGYQPYQGMLAEYNGKFMCNQFVLRGGCVATPPSHYRHSYRNFYLPEQRWMFSGLKLARDVQ